MRRQRPRPRRGGCHVRRGIYAKEMPEKLWVGDVQFSYEETMSEGEAKGRATTEAFGYRFSGSMIHVSAFGLRLYPADVDREFPEPTIAVEPTVSEREAERESRTETTDELLQKLTSEEFENWTPTVEAHKRVFATLISHSSTASAFALRLRSGLLRAGAENHAFARDRDSPRGVIEIEARRWEQFDDLHEEWDFWRTGTLTVQVDARGALASGLEELTYFGVRFDPTGLAKMMAAVGIDSPSSSAQSAPVIPPSAPLLMPQIPSTKHAGGAPPKEFWDDLWIEVARLVHAGDIHPSSSQAHVARLMQDWATGRGGLGETSAKNAARKLMAVLRADVKN